MFTAYKNLPTYPNINKSPPNERTGAAFFSNTGSAGKTAIDWLIVAQPKVREGRNGQRFTDCPTLRNAIHFAHKNPCPPGEILATMYLEPLGLTVTQAVVALNMPRAALSKIVNGKRVVTPQTALKLQKAFNQPAAFWLPVQSHGS